MCLNGSDQTTSCFLATSKTESEKRRAQFLCDKNGWSKGTGELELIMYWKGGRGGCRACEVCLCGEEGHWITAPQVAPLNRPGQR